MQVASVVACGNRLFYITIQAAETGSIFPPAQEEISPKFSSGYLQGPDVTGLTGMKKKQYLVSMKEKSFS